MRWRLVASNVCEAVTPPRPARREIAALDEHQAVKLIQAAKAMGSVLYVPVVLALTTGLRRGEIYALTWDDLALDVSTPTVTVRPGPDARRETAGLRR